MGEYKDQMSNEIYSLYGILTHRGNSLNSGHYLAYVKDFLSNSWVLFND
jgi:uncharacterized UBP type Zn finger protein